MNEQIENVGEEKKEILTKVTSIAQEEAVTGKKFELPPPEEIAANAMSAYIRAMQDLHKKITDKSISKISVAKGILSGLDLPEENLPVSLKTNDEKEIFALTQTVVNCRYLLTQYHIDIRRKQMIAEQQAKNEVPKTEENNVPQQTTEGVSSV